jgi:formylmethanofuran--tetrahydromethanopterin N-formyltransferase
MPNLTVKGIRIDDTYAEAFGMRATAIVITADSARWAQQAALTMTGFATSVIGCGCEAGIDRALSGRQTPDGRPGVRVLVFAVSSGELQKQLQKRVAQCVLTSPGSACYAGIDGEETLRLGNALRYFGDGWQISKRFGTRHFWRIPVMDGEFVCEATTPLTSRRRQSADPGPLHENDARRGGSRDRCNGECAGRHHAVSGRHRALRLQGRLEIQGRHRIDQ